MKRVFAMLVAFIMVFSMLPASIFAEGETYTVTRTIIISGTGKVNSMLGNDEKTFEHSGSGTASYTHTVTVSVGRGCSYQLEAVSDEVYAFDGWYKNGQLYYQTFWLPIGQPLSIGSQEAGSTYTIDTVEAKFVERTYSVWIHFTAEEGGSVDPEEFKRNNVPAADWTEISATATPDVHHDFEGWYLNGSKVSENAKLTDSVNSKYLYDLIERTYTAKFTPKTYGVAFVDPESVFRVKTVQLRAEPVTRDLCEYRSRRNTG